MQRRNQRRRISDEAATIRNDAPDRDHAGTCLTPAPAFAGIADSPLPVLVAGKTTYHLYSVPGVMDDLYFLGTFFSCTSTDKATIQVA